MHVLSRIISVNPREIQVKGEARKIFYGILGDESGTIQFTAWKDFELEKGTVVDITNAYTKEWQGSLKVNFGDRTRVTKVDASELPEMNLEPRAYKVNELRGGLSSVEVTARILETQDREVDISGQKKKVFSGVLGDETGKAQFTAWHDFKLKEGTVVKITGGYVKSWKGIPQFTFDEKATVEKLDANTIAKKDVKTQKIRSLSWWSATVHSMSKWKAPSLRYRKAQVLCNAARNATGCFSRAPARSMGRSKEKQTCG